MKFIYQGKYSGDPTTLPAHPHEENAVKYKEFENTKQFAMFMNSVSIVLVIILLVAVFARSGIHGFSFWGCLLSVVVLIPHEFLHAVCFKNEVYMYQNLKEGMLFVTGPETFSKLRFIVMSMMPNIIFGFIPFFLFLIFPTLRLLGTFGALSIASGVGDYYNVYNTLRQVPHNGRIYMNGFNSWWYLPNTKKEN